MAAGAMGYALASLPSIVRHVAITLSAPPTDK
jgi:hypothetical protein